MKKTITLIQLVGAVSMAALLSACENVNGTATIRYEQLGACNSYKDGSNTASVGPNAAYVLFKINVIDNRSGKVGFTYDPSRLCLASAPSACVAPTLSLASKIGVLGTTSQAVPAGKDLLHDGYGVLVASTASSPDPQIEANKVNYFLTYASSSGDPGVLLDKKNAGQTVYLGVQNCLDKTTW